MTSLAASVPELVVASSMTSPLEPAVSEATPRSVLGYQRCSSRPFSGCRSAWSDGRLRLKKPHCRLEHGNFNIAVFGEC